MAEVALVIGLIGTTLSIIFGIKNNKRTDTKDIEERVKENTKINFKLDNISQTTQEIKGEISSMREEIKVHNDKLIILEQSCKAAHRRMDTFEERMNLNGGKHNEQ